MGVGSLIWERHGHIALCVCGEATSEDRCYNYGIGDFHHPIDMALGFFRGSNSFWAGRMDVRDMLGVYLYADRTIWVQPLPLTAEQRQKMVAKLESDILDENKYYAYDHFWDNCTTRVRDIIDDVTDHALSTMKVETDDRTYRDLAREGFFGMRIPLLITDLAMGRVTDRLPSYWERMFLPDYLREAVATKWGVQPIAIYQRRGSPSLKELEKELADKDLSPERRAAAQQQLDDLRGSPSGRVLFALVVILLTAPAWATRLWGRFQRTGLSVSVVPYLLLGTILWVLALISPLPYVRWNETCLVLLPVDVLLLFLSPARKQTYARGRVIMLAGYTLLMLVGVFKQPIWPAVLWALIPNAVVGFWPANREGQAASGAGTVGTRSRT